MAYHALAAQLKFFVTASAVALVLLGPAAARASDHLDTPTVIADPRADIGDLFAWTSSDGRRLNLVMTIVGHSFSDKIDYVFHVDSGKEFGKTRRTTAIHCSFPSKGITRCSAGLDDRADGDASHPTGLQSSKHRFRVFAGLRDDPFFNNVKGTRAAYSVVLDALERGTARDPAGCPLLTEDHAANLLTEWRHTDGRPANNLLKGWTPASIVIAIDLPLVAKGGNVLAVWAVTRLGDRQIDRAGRPLTGNALLGTIATDEVADALKEKYNAATPSTSAPFIAEIEKGLALYDGFDGACGNQWLIEKQSAPSARYRTLATLLADDRLWINTGSRDCSQLFAVELAYLSRQKQWRKDCGGRTPNYNAVNEYRSLLANGTLHGIDDGLTRDERDHSADVFPFLAEPE
ncbi:MAG: hypothetical protein JWP34_895 [Massilia sp.]|nr:hypothetical protein [Massilia sp.]